MKFILLGFLCMSLYAMGTTSLKDNTRAVSVILKIDKTNSKYSSVLADVTIYPKINWEKFNRQSKTQYHEFVKSILPYLLVKVKAEDLSTQAKTFTKLLKSSKDMANFVNTSKSEEVIHSFLLEKLRVDQELKVCADIKTQFKGQESMMKVQLSRVDLEDEEFLIKELSSISNRLHYISSEFSK